MRSPSSASRSRPGCLAGVRSTCGTDQVERQGQTATPATNPGASKTTKVNDSAKIAKKAAQRSTVLMPAARPFT